ncbi:MAG: hypothetical protein R2854_20505 [Caldilineaceae bacterium]
MSLRPHPASFYRPVGRLLVESPSRRGQETALDVAAAEGIDRKSTPGDDAWRPLPGPGFPRRLRRTLRAGSGVRQLRGMLQAQLTVMTQQGATVIRETVVDVQTDGGRHRDTDMGATYRADKVLVAAAAFTNFNNLLRTHPAQAQDRGHHPGPGDAGGRGPAGRHARGQFTRSSARTLTAST